MFSNIATSEDIGISLFWQQYVFLSVDRMYFSCPPKYTICVQPIWQVEQYCNIRWKGCFHGLIGVSGQDALAFLVLWTAQLLSQKSQEISEQSPHWTPLTLTWFVKCISLVLFLFVRCSVLPSHYCVCICILDVCANLLLAVYLYFYMYLQTTFSQCECLSRCIC